MCKYLKDWTPSKAAIDLIKLNEINAEQMARTLDYLMHESGLSDIDSVDGYDNWNSLCIMFCIKANKQPDQ